LAFHYAEIIAIYSGNKRSFNMCCGRIAELYERALAVASVITMLERVRRGQV
jgi:hypothetical protein